MIIIPILRHTIREIWPQLPPMEHTIEGKGPVPSQLTEQGFCPNSDEMVLDRNGNVVGFKGPADIRLIEWLGNNLSIGRTYKLTVKRFRDLPTWWPMLPSYKHDHLPTKLLCSNCGWRVPVGEIEEVSSADEENYASERCPVCKAIDTFPDYRYERMSEVRGFRG